MSAADTGWQFDVAVEPEPEEEGAEPPTRDDYMEPDKRVTAHAYKSGHVELRTALDGEYLNTTHPVNVRDFR